MHYLRNGGSKAHSKGGRLENALPKKWWLKGALERR
jgi:hypothetical protein